MKFILFCNLPYSFAILETLESQIKLRGYQYIWYIPKELEANISYEHYTSDIKKLKKYQADVIFVAGNEVPHYLRGVKTQIFHGLAGEKKGHFRIRDYFDLYLTQGRYFTDKFNQLRDKHKNFEVIETGWCKLDNLYNNNSKLLKYNLLKEYNASKILLYSPTFSPSLTSGDKLLDVINSLSQNSNILLIIKFHDKMDRDIIEKYLKLESKNLIIWTQSDITPLLQISDIMISDTSSVVYEFILLNKPVVTLNSNSENIHWVDCQSNIEVEKEVIDIINGIDKFKDKRENIIELYHPYSDGQSSSRMIDAVENYIKEFGVPQKRKLSFLRRVKIWKIY